MAEAKAPRTPVATQRVKAAKPARGQTLKSLVAAAKRVVVSKERESDKARIRKEEWQSEAWDYFDSIGEVKYAMNYLGSSLSKVRIFAAEEQGPDEDPVETDSADAQIALERIAGDTGDHSELMRFLGLNLSIPGEGYLIGVAPRPIKDKPGEMTPETWGVYSIDEIETGSDKVQKLKGGGYDDEDVALGEEDFILRVWNPHPRKRSKADSSLHGVLSICEELLLLERGSRAILKSRLHAGFLKVPLELDFSAMTPPSEGADDDDETPFEQELMEAMITPIQDEDAASAVVPIPVRGTTENLKGFEHLVMQRPGDQFYDQRTERALKRLAQGVNVPVEVVLGVADVNHWNVWQVSDDAFKAHIEPLVWSICSALTAGYLRPTLEEVGVDARRFRVWYDATKLIAPVDRSQDVKDAHDRLLISDATARKAYNFAEDDAPDDEERARRILEKNPSAAAPLTLGLVTALDPTVQAVPVPVAPQAEPSSNGNGAPPTGASAIVAAAGSSFNLGARLSRIDQSLRERLQVAGDEALKRALERAGARIRSKVRGNAALRAAAYGIAAIDVASRIGEDTLTAAGVGTQDVLHDAFDAYMAKWERWVRAAQAEVASEVAAAVGLDEAQLAELSDRQVAALRDASRWLEDQLFDYARKRIFDPHPSAPLVGEFDADSIPAGMIREALARAGGASNLQTIAGSEWATAIDAGQRPVGGVGFGGLIEDLLQQQGAGVEGYEWVYGAYPRRTFEPHAMLDGVRFTSWDDPLLANNESFPETAFFLPGDHDGCRCDFVPIILAPVEAAEAVAE